MKPILSLDFDGVIHSYKSGWCGPRRIPDLPVPGALEFIVRALEVFDVQIYSSRSSYWGGRRAMRYWLAVHYAALMGDGPSDSPDWLARHMLANAFVDPWEEEIRMGAINLVQRIGFPKHKPPAMVTLDDRALTFTGEWPELADLLAFRPWYK